MKSSSSTDGPKAHPSPKQSKLKDKQAREAALATYPAGTPCSITQACHAKAAGRSSYVQAPDWIAALDRCFNILNTHRWIDAHTVRSSNRWSRSHGSEKIKSNLPQLLQLVKFWGEPGSAFSFGNDKQADTFYSLEFDMEPYGGLEHDHLPLEWYGDEDMIRTKAIDQDVLRTLIEGGLVPQFRWSGNKSLVVDYFFDHAVPTDLLAGLHYVTTLLVPNVESDASSHKTYRNGKEQDSCYRLPGSWHQTSGEISTYFGRAGQGIEGVVEHLQQVDRCALSDEALAELMGSVTGEVLDTEAMDSDEANRVLHSNRLRAGHVLASKDATAEQVVFVDLLDSFAGLDQLLLPDERSFAAGSWYLLHRSVSHRRGFAHWKGVPFHKVVTIFASQSDAPDHKEPAKVTQAWLTQEAAELYESWIQQGVPQGMSHQALHAIGGFKRYVLKREGRDMDRVEAVLTSALITLPKAAGLEPTRLADRRAAIKSSMQHLRDKDFTVGSAGPVVVTEGMEQALQAVKVELIEKNPKNQRKYAEFAGKVLDYIVRKAWLVGRHVGVGVAEITEQFDLPNENEDYIHARRVLKYLRKHGMIAMVEDYVTKRLVRVFKLRADLEAQLPGPAPVATAETAVLASTGTDALNPEQIEMVKMVEGAATLKSLFGHVTRLMRVAGESEIIPIDQKGDASG